jgi:hypothetical protein
MKSLRLILWDDCLRQCKDCANRAPEAVNAEVLDRSTIDQYDEIILTGGEPLLYPQRLVRAMTYIRTQMKPSAKMYVYTAMPHPVEAFIKMLKLADGVTLTLHSQRDVRDAGIATAYIIDNLLAHKSLRLHSFGATVPEWKNVWEYKDKVWLEECPLPENETLRRW